MKWIRRALGFVANAATLVVAVVLAFCVILSILLTPAQRERKKPDVRRN